MDDGGRAHAGRRGSPPAARGPRLAPHLPGSGVLTGTVAGVSALALAGSLARLGGVADLLAAGLVLATVAGAGALFLVAAYRASRARWRRRPEAPGTR